MRIKFGRLVSIDDRDKLYPVSAVLHTPPDIPNKYWWAEGWWGNQGSSQMCVAYSWSHWIEDGPVIQDVIYGRTRPMFDVTQFYDACQARDPWEGNSYDGTSVRAGAKILKTLEVISEYRWANSLQDVIDTLLMLGPMVVGTKWYKGMYTPDRKGMISPTGRQSGGHAYIIDGVDKINRVFRIKNSWGRNWGKKGFAFITFDDFESLLHDAGEACIAFENKMYDIPLIEDLPPPINP